MYCIMKCLQSVHVLYNEMFADCVVRLSAGWDQILQLEGKLRANKARASPRNS